MDDTRTELLSDTNHTIRHPSPGVRKMLDNIVPPCHAPCWPAGCKACRPRVNGIKKQRAVVHHPRMVDNSPLSQRRCAQSSPHTRCAIQMAAHNQRLASFQAQRSCACASGSRALNIKTESWNPPSFRIRGFQPSVSVLRACSYDGPCMALP